ncbi:hypothetical protein M1146_07005, partial [Patescibacteria group bacterium]|nr:hypothetical protein [Patescibacteria group bacterium]
MLELNEHLNDANLLLRSLNQVRYPIQPIDLFIKAKLTFVHRNSSSTPVYTSRRQTELLSYIHSLLELPDELDILTSGKFIYAVSYILERLFAFLMCKR